MSTLRPFVIWGSAIGISLAVVACGGGGGGGGSMNPPPTIPPSIPASIPPSPFACPSGGCTSFTLAGTRKQTITRLQPTPPPPPGITNINVSETINVLSGKVFHGKPATDYQTVESDAAPTQTITTNTDNYIQFPAVNGPIVNIGFASTDSNGVALDVQYMSGNGQIGVVPLTSGWENNASTVISETDPDGTTFNETINADGSYTFTKIEAAGTTNATMNSDGTGTATVPTTLYCANVIPPCAGSTGTRITIPVQSGGMINFTLSAVGLAPPTPAPLVLPAGAWYPPSPTLASDKSTIAGTTSIPAGCVTPQFGPKGVQVHRVESRLDTIFGLSENEVTDDWVTSVGTVCEKVSDTITIYYDFTNQSPFSIIIGGPNAIQTTGITELVGLHAAARSSAVREPTTHGQTTPGFSQQLVFARDRIERFRLSVRRHQLERLISSLNGRRIK